MKREDISFISDLCIIGVVLLVLFYFAFDVLLSVLLPFLLAYLVAAIIRKPALFISEKTKIPVGGVSFVMIIIFIVAVCSGLWLLLNKLLYEAGELISRLALEEGKLSELFSAFSARIKSITSVFPALDSSESELLSSMCSRVDLFVYDSVNNFLKEFSVDIGRIISSVIKTLPETFLYILVTLIASVYISSQFSSVNSFVSGMIPKKYREKLSVFKMNAFSALAAYFKAYSIIYFITLGELFLGLSLLGVKNAFIISILIALVDILPVFGVGIVLIPWALVSLMLGSTKRFFILAALYIVITVVREIIEPKIIGKSIGLPPLPTLFIMFSGYKLFGVTGMIVAPVLAVALFGSFKYKLPKSEKSANNT